MIVTQIENILSVDTRGVVGAEYIRHAKIDCIQILEEGVD